MNSFRILPASLVCALSLGAGALAEAQNPVADWDSNTLTAVVSIAKKSPAVAPVYFEQTEIGQFWAHPARIFGGMHFRHSVKEGNRLGRRVADFILTHHFNEHDR